MSKDVSLEADVAELEPNAEEFADGVIEDLKRLKSQPSNDDAKPKSKPQTRRSQVPRTKKIARDREQPPVKLADDPSVTFSTKIAYSVRKKLDRVWHERGLKNQEFTSKREIVEEGLRLFFQKYGHQA